MMAMLSLLGLGQQAKTRRILTYALSALGAFTILTMGCADDLGAIDAAYDAAFDFSASRDMSRNQADLDLLSANPDGGFNGVGVAQCPCHGCAWRGTQAFCWGANTFGALGDNTQTSRNSAATVQGLAAVGTIAQMAVGCGNPSVSGHTCALNTAGELWCWGSNMFGQLGDQTATDQALPVKIGGLPALIGISLGAMHTCAVAGNGHVYCWGNNQSLQIGDGTSVDRAAPTQIAVTNVVEVSAGSFHSCVRLSSGKLSCWGANNYGEVGNRDIAGAPSPTAVIGIDDAVRLTTGQFHTCANRASGGAWCWGAGMYGTLGNGTTPNSQLIPVQVGLGFSPAELSSVTAICARDAQGPVSCWGGAIDQTGAIVIHASPVAVQLSDAVALGGSCAVRVDGTVSCWGFNSDGQIGDGTNKPRAAPSDVVGIVWQ